MNFMGKRGRKKRKKGTDLFIGSLSVFGTSLPVVTTAYG